MYLISACLCGVNCKYNGLNNLNDKCLELLRKGEALLVCPEQLGGLNTPRIPSETLGNAKDIIELNKGKVINKEGKDVTKEFLKGAKEALKIAKEANIKKAILKESSPSCGSNFVYDGSFTGNKIKGKGITAYLLEKEGIEIISEKDLD
jgi:uncharacterized protein YbbK (DUF523 family)